MGSNKNNDNDDDIVDYSVYGPIVMEVQAIRRKIHEEEKHLTHEERFLLHKKQGEEYIKKYNLRVAH